MAQNCYFCYNSQIMTKKTVSALSLALLTMQLVVPVALAEGTCAISALDTVAGLGTQVTVSHCESSAQTTLTMSGPSNQNYSQPIALDASGNALTLIPSKVTVTAGRYTVNAAGKSTSFTVLADRADDSSSLINVSRNSIAADGNDGATVTAILRDRYDNPVTGRPLALIASRVADQVDPQSKQTDENGRFLWTVRSTVGGSMSLTVYDIASNRQMKLQAMLTVVQTAGRSPLSAMLTGFAQGGDSTAYAADAPLAASSTDLVNTNPNAVIDHFELSLPQGATEVKANDLFGIEIRAMRGSETVRSYIGTLVVKSSDSDADLPKKGEDPRNPTFGRIDMRDVDQGERNVPLAFVLRAGGRQTIEVFDKQNPAITGTLTVNVTQSGTNGGNTQIVILDPKDRSTIKGGPVLLQGRAPSLVNLKVKGGSSEVNGESDQEGVFRISVPINPADKEVTLFVASENGTYESDPVHIIIDNTGPAIETITLTPTETKATEQTTIVVKSEIGLASVTAVSGTQTVTLVASGALYSGTLTAPAQEGIYDITVTATDSAANVTTMLTKWNVIMKTFPIVQNVTAEGLAASVKLTWAAVTAAPVSEYRIYIATEQEPANYLYSIETNKPVTSAVIKDLPAGKTYQFSLTAIGLDGTESPEKSAPATAAPLGMNLTAVAGKDSVLLQWTAIADLPLDHYVLQYGTSPGEYPETRTVNGQATSFMVRDLLNGVTYEFKLTPVTVTGKQMDELAGVTRGTPGGTGFTAGATDPVPNDLLHSGAPIEQRPPLVYVPQNTSTGVPSMVLGFLLIVSLMGGMHWRYHQKERRLTTEFLAAMQDRYMQ